MSADEFTLERTLGEGAFGKVYLVKDQDSNQVFQRNILDFIGIFFKDWCMIS